MTKPKPPAPPKPQLDPERTIWAGEAALILQAARELAAKKPEKG